MAIISIVPAVVSASEAASLARQISNADHVDGRQSAGRRAVLVKHNLVVDQASTHYKSIAQSIEAAVRANSLLNSIALPSRFSNPVLSIFSIGKGYCNHIDNSFLGTPPMTTDLSFTLFLSEPVGYQGGEFVIEDMEGSHQFKLEPGYLLAYDAEAVHRVETVTKGRRIVASGWIQSLCRELWQRESLFEIQQVRDRLFEDEPSSADGLVLAKVHAALLRKFAG